MKSIEGVPWYNVLPCLAAQGLLLAVVVPLTLMYNLLDAYTVEPSTRKRLE